jgi:hypothetical protein
MGTHRQTRSIETNEELEFDPLELAQEFYEANGYEVDPSSGEGALVMTRGKAGNGWWTSDMTELLATARVLHRHTALMVTCEVDTTGQHFVEEDEAFWSRELDALAAYVRGEDQMPEDLRADEGARARSRSRSSFSTGLYGMFLVAFTIFALFMAFQLYIRMAAR